MGGDPLVIKRGWEIPPCLIPEGYLRCGIALHITGLCLGLLRDGDIAIYIYIHQTMAILVVEIMINHVLLFLHFQTYHFMVYQPTLLSQG